VPEWLTENLQKTLVGQLKQGLPEALGAAMSNQQVLQALTEGVTAKISKRIDREIQQTVVPQIQTSAVQAATNVTKETEKRITEQLTRTDLKAREDTAKIDNLTKLTEDLLSTVHAMSETQQAMRSEITALQAEVQRLRSHEVPSEIAKVEQPAEPASDPELDSIISLMNEGRFEEGTIQWLQSRNQSTLFDKFFVKFDPAYLQPLPSLVSLSVGAAVIQRLEENIHERLHWLSSVLSFVDPQDPEVSNVAPSIMDVIVSRLESRYMSLAEADLTDPLLKTIPPLTKAAKGIKSLAQSRV